MLSLTASRVCVAVGAQKEGAAGFFKGVGKGLVGVLTRPTGGIIDMASSTFQGIKRSLNMSAYLCALFRNESLLVHDCDVFLA